MVVGSRFHLCIRDRDLEQVTNRSNLISFEFLDLVADVASRCLRAQVVSLDGLGQDHSGASIGTTGQIKGCGDFSTVMSSATQLLKL
jgi:hypothetical protein